MGETTMNKSRILLISFALLLLIVGLSYGVSALRYDMHVTDVEYDGWCSTTTIYNTTTYVLAQATTSDYWGFVEWNISTIPAHAQITNVSFEVYSLGYSGPGILNGYEMESRPSTLTASQIAADSQNGTKYISIVMSTFTGNTGEKDVNSTSNEWYPLTDVKQDIQDNISRGWWAMGFDPYLNPWDAGSTTYAKWASRNHSSEHAARLWIEYDLSAPIFNESMNTPADGATDVNLTPQICVNLSHPDDFTMNITFYWWNGTGWEYFYNYTSVNNGTYCAPFMNATDPCTTYYFWVEAVDQNGNETSIVYEFTTHCIDPPTSLDCSVHNATALNLTWTEKPNNNGTTHTLIYYEKGTCPPSWGFGTLGANTTNETAIISDLDQGSCYAFSFWTNWNSSNGTYYLSASRGTHICCTAGGDYTICLKYEDRNQDPINLSDYPCSNHTLYIHYTDGLMDTYLINNQTYVDNNFSSCFTIGASGTVLFFELYWNETINPNCTGAGFDSHCSYRRTLLPSAASNDTGNKTITFYLITDRNVYLDYYYNFTAGATLETDMAGHLVPYIFNFDDRSHIFDTKPPNDASAAFYCYNVTDKLIIHQQYWDSAQKVYPVLIHEKAYFVEVNCSTEKYSNIGLAPNQNLLEEEIIITRISDEGISFGEVIDLSFGWVDAATGLYVHYTDTETSTSWVNCTIYDTDYNIVYTYQIASNEYNFTWNAANQSQTYFINITFSHDMFTAITTVQFPLHPGMTALTTAATIEGLFYNIFGLSPFYNIDTGEAIPWATLIMFAIAVLIFGALITYSPVLSIAAPGIWIIGFSTMVSGFDIAYIAIGFLLISLAIVYALAGGQNR